MAKSLPGSQFIKDAFNINVTFPKEVEFYQNILPEFIKLLEENKIDIDYKKSFPKFVGAELIEKDGVLEDATLIMENIKVDGYQLRPKTEGMDYVHSKMVIKELALFHALGIALKIKKPQVYETKIKKTARPLKLGQSVEAAKKEIYDFMDQTLDYLKGIKEVEHLVPRLKKVMYDNFLYADMLEGYKPREPFSTFVHNDMWLNNMMFKYNNGEPSSLKLLDFQRTKLGSPISDLFLFLYVSTSLDVVRNNFDEMLKLYHDTFLGWLTQLNVPTKDFSWENFQEELKHGSEEVSMPVAMMRLLFMKVDVDPSEIEMDTFGKIGDGNPDCEIRHVYVVQDLAKRGWI